MLSDNAIEKRCPKGYRSDKKTHECITVDEYNRRYHSGREPPKPGEEPNGSRAKHCPKGYRADKKTHRCITIEEYNRKYHPERLNPDQRKKPEGEDNKGSRTKHCPKGYRADKKTHECIPIAEYNKRWHPERGEDGRSPKRVRKPKEEKPEEPKEEEYEKEFTPKHTSLNTMATSAISKNRYATKEQFDKLSSMFEGEYKPVSPNLRAREHIKRVSDELSKPDIDLNKTIEDIGCRVTREDGIFSDPETSDIPLSEFFKVENDRKGVLEAIQTSFELFPYTDGSLRGIGTYNNQRGYAHMIPSEFIISFNEKYIDHDHSQKYASEDCTPIDTRNPLGEADNISFHFAQPEGSSWVKSSICHELGHMASYTTLAMVRNRRKLDKRIEVAKGLIPPTMDVPEEPKEKDLASRCTYYKKLLDILKKEAKQNTNNDYVYAPDLESRGVNNGVPYNEYREVIQDTHVFTKPGGLLDEFINPEPTGRNEGDFQNEIVKQCKDVYKKLYLGPKEKFNPFDAYSSYGFYGHPNTAYDAMKNSRKWDYVKQPDGNYKVLPRKVKDGEWGSLRNAVNHKDEDRASGEKIAEAFGDVSARGENANSMSQLLVACISFQYQKAVTGDDQTFEEFILSQYSKEELKNMKGTQIKKYIVFSQMPIAKRGHCPPGYHKDGRGQCRELDAMGNPTGPIYQEKVNQQKEQRRREREHRKDKKPQGKKRVDIANETFILAKPGSKEWKMVKNLKTGSSEEARASRKAIIDFYNKHGYIPRIEIEPFEMDGVTYDGKTTTYTLFTDEHGKYTKEREKVHEEILNQWYHNLKIPTNRKPVVVFTGGGTASGKGSMDPILAEKFGIQEKDIPRKEGETDAEYAKRKSKKLEKTLEYYKIDPDAIMEKLPGYKEYLEHDMIGGASVFHREASDLAKRMYDMAIQMGADFIYDGTFSSGKPLKWAEEIDHDKYDSHLVGKITDVDICRKRSGYRFINGGKNGEYPRIVPDSILTSSNEGFRKNIKEHDMDKIFTSWKTIEDKENKKKS